jgi:hypothetical protein
VHAFISFCWEASETLVDSVQAVGANNGARRLGGANVIPGRVPFVSPDSGSDVGRVATAMMMAASPKSS